MNTQKRNRHAEEDLISKIKYNYKKIKSIDICVVKFVNTTTLGISKPCINCTKMIRKQLYKKGYDVHNIYYSTKDNTIECVSIHELEKQHNLLLR